ncbi:MAG: MerR family transcriptional regulator [Bacteroidetes bacterium]|nr:MerR family transcriptional regulator [Bacteroidota bacterium]
MPYKEKDTEKLFYTIGELSTMFNVKTSLIRFWEKEFDIIKPKKNNKGNRLFTKEDVNNFQTIFHLVKERGFTLQGAKTKLKGGQETLDNVEVVQRLLSIKEQLLDLKNEIDN